MRKLNICYNMKLVKNYLSQNKINPQQIIKKGKDREEGRYKHKDNTRCIIEEETETLGVKPLRRPPSGKQSTRKCSWDIWTAIDPPSLIYPVHLSPPSFLLQRGYTEPFSFLTSRIPLLDHNINQCRLVLS